MVISYFFICLNIEKLIFYLDEISNKLVIIIKSERSEFRIARF